MGWQEAFGRAARAILASLLIFIVGLVPLLLGGRLIFRDFLAVNAWVAGGLLVLAGLVFIALGALAVVIKTLTTAVSEGTGQGTSISWPEAFGRAARATLAAALIGILGLLLLLLGVWLIVENLNAAVPFITGGLLVLAGLVFIALGGLAVAIKTLTTAVSDYVRQGSSMSWSEAFGRAARATLAAALIGILGLLLSLVGFWMIYGEEWFFGWLVLLPVVIFLQIGGYAVAIKTLTAAVSDHAGPDVGRPFEMRHRLPFNHESRSDIKDESRHLNTPGLRCTYPQFEKRQPFNLPQKA